MLFRSRARKLPPAPRELQGGDLKVDYISLLAQAQRAVGTGAISQLTRFVGALAPARPELFDKLDLDQAVDEMGGMLGVPPKLIVADDRVKAVREQRARRQQMAATAQAAVTATEGAKTLAETPTDGRNALTDLLGRLRR